MLYWHYCLCKIILVTSQSLFLQYFGWYLYTVIYRMAFKFDINSLELSSLGLILLLCWNNTNLWRLVWKYQVAHYSLAIFRPCSYLRLLYLIWLANFTRPVVLGQTDGILSWHEMFQRPKRMKSRRKVGIGQWKCNTLPKY